MPWDDEPPLPWNEPPVPWDDEPPVPWRGAARALDDEPPLPGEEPSVPWDGSFPWNRCPPVPPEALLPEACQAERPPCWSPAEPCCGEGSDVAAAGVSADWVTDGEGDADGLADGDGDVG